jgi:hypothetical protein
MVFGKACRTSSGRLPLLTVTGRPAIGGTYLVNLNPLVSEVNSAAVLRIGNSKTSIGGEGTLPRRLEAAAGCMVYTNAISATPFVPSGLGVSLPQVVPNNQSLIGTEVYLQFQVADPRRNVLGRVYSNAAQVMIGQ